jgi:glycosyltransferase involved in cell wall biosynthesis
MGGAEKRFTETMKIYCNERDLEITVLESAPSLLNDSDVTCKKCVLKSSFSGNGWLSTYLEWTIWIVEACFKSFSIVRNTKPHLIFVPNNSLPNLLSGWFIALVLRLPICIVVHHIDVPFVKTNSKKYSFYEGYRKIKYGRLVSFLKAFAFYVSLPLLRRATTIIAVSNFTVRILKGLGVSKPKTSTSGNAVNLDFIREVKPRSREKIYDGIFVGRITKEKGAFDLLRVWKNVAKARKNAKLLVIGSGLELSMIKDRIVTLGLENRVFLRGRVADDELYGLLKASRVFIFPSLFEGWGIAVAEALACGLPVVAYDIPALREIFAKCDSVFLVPAKDIENMSSTVLDILSLCEEKYSELGEFATTYSYSFSWKKIAQKDLETLKQTV